MHSLRTQLTLGAVILLGATVASLSYLLIKHQRTVLTAEIENKVVLQGRNIALTSQKFLLRPDPEFDLYPMIQRLLDGGSAISSVVIVDENGVVQGHPDLRQVDKRYNPDLSAYEAASAGGIRSDEALYEDENEFVFVTPIVSVERRTGSVYLTYSKRDLKENLARAFRISLSVSLGILAIGVVLSLFFFRHISRPLERMLDAVRSIDGDNPAVYMSIPAHNEFALLAHAFNDMSRRIVDAQRALSVRERMQRELELAREIQHSLLPHKITPPRGYDIDHFYQAAYEVGGDYVDAVALDEHRFAIAMGDVSGKGVQGLVVMAMVKTLFQQLAPRSGSAREIIRDLNAALYGNIKRNMFVTFVVAIFDAQSGRMFISNAGHNPCLLYNHRLRTVERIRLGGPPLGAFGQLHFDDLIEEREIVVGVDDAVVFYTDGINESRDPEGHQFSIAGIESTLHRHRLGTASEMVHGIVDAAAEFRTGAAQPDDVTLLVLKRGSRVREPEPSEVTS